MIEFCEISDESELDKKIYRVRSEFLCHCSSVVVDGLINTRYDSIDFHVQVSLEIITKINISE